MTPEIVGILVTIALGFGAVLIRLGDLKGTVITRLDEHKETLDDHEERLREQERKAARFHTAASH